VFEVFCTLNQNTFYSNENCILLYILECTRLGAELDIYQNIARCIAANTPAIHVDMDTKRLTAACTDLYGPSSQLIHLPENEKSLWNYLVKHLNS